MLPLLVDPAAPTTSSSAPSDRFAGPRKFHVPRIFQRRRPESKPTDQFTFPSDQPTDLSLRSRSPPPTHGVSTLVILQPREPFRPRRLFPLSRTFRLSLGPAEVDHTFPSLLAISTLPRGLTPPPRSSEDGEDEDVWESAGEGEGAEGRGIEAVGHDDQGPRRATGLAALSDFRDEPSPLLAPIDQRSPSSTSPPSWTHHAH